MIRGRGAVLSTLISDPSVLEARGRVLFESSHGSPFTARHSKLTPIPWGASLGANSKFCSSGRKISFWHKFWTAWSCCKMPEKRLSHLPILQAVPMQVFPVSLNHKEDFSAQKRMERRMPKWRRNQKTGRKLPRAAEESDPAGRSTKINYVNLWWATDEWDISVFTYAI